MIDTVAIGEFLAYDLPNEYYNNTNDASGAIVQVMQYILNNNLVPQYSGLTTENYANLPNDNQDNWVTRFGLPQNYPYTQEEIDALTDVQAMRFLIIMSTLPRTSITEIEANLLATYLVAVCKKGTATNAFIRKIVRGINDDIRLTSIMLQ